MTCSKTYHKLGFYELEKLVMSECSKNTELRNADADVDIDPVCSEDPAYPDNESEYYTAIYLFTISEHIFQNIYYWLCALCYVRKHATC